MFKSYLERVRMAGVVGAGGAGFPSHIKLKAEAEVVIGNGAECEPLLRVDQTLMAAYAQDILRGLKIAMKITRAGRGVICLKKKYHHAVEAIEQVLVEETADIKIHLIDNFYPAGDEHQVVYEVTGRAISVGGIPIQVGAVVLNVNTLLNIARAAEGIPVTAKHVTITGAVRNKKTVLAPIGTPIRRLLEHAGLPEDPQQYRIVLGGPAMGTLTDDWDAPVTKTLGGIILLHKEHRVIRMKDRDPQADYRLAKAACCQCNYCTQLCPRQALGQGVEPHRVMMSMAVASSQLLGDGQRVLGCNQCGVCTMYACNMGLNPSTMMGQLRQALLRAGIKATAQAPKINVTRQDRKIPVGRLIQRLGLTEYDAADVAFEPELMAVDHVRIPLRQHIGKPAIPEVAVGDLVERGTCIADMGDGDMGAPIHASMNGRVCAVTDEYIEIEGRC